MSNRTAEADRAIAKAWKREQIAILSGRGTRDWSPEQQRDILDRGKAYDEDGKAFQGHHMKSVEEYPEFQGDPNIIQFLSRNEHLDAHSGWFGNSTNGYYNPLTGETSFFEDGSYELVHIIKLSQPIVCEVETSIESDKKQPDVKERVQSETPKESKKQSSSNANQVVAVSRQHPKGQNKVKKFIETIKVFYTDHETEIKIARTLGGTVINIVSIVSGLDTVGSYSASLAKIGKITKTTNSIVKVVEKPIEIIERVSPIEHQVSGYYRIQNGKKVYVRPYVRGKRI